LSYPSISEIELKWRSSASRFCIIVEGATEQDDAWFYEQWFGGRARDVMFFPQNGWDQVLNAVNALRGILGAQFVFGIVDRDFRESPVYDTPPADGILWTAKYTLENYLLNPECWFKVTRPFTRRSAKSGWNSPEEVEQTILTLYQKCIPLAACNSTLKFASQLDDGAFRNLSESQQKHKTHPKALENLGDLSNYFQTIQNDMGLSIDLDEKYTTRLAELQTMTVADLDQHVSGKYVIKLLHDEFPMGSLTKQAWDDTLGAYIDACPDAPEDLSQLIDLIVHSQ